MTRQGEKKSDALATARDATLAAQEIALTPENVARFINDKASPDEIAMFLNICLINNLNPFKREVFLIKYSERDPAQYVIGYETYLKRAERTGKWNGFEVTTEGSVSDGSLKAVCKVYRKDWERPLAHEVYYEEYVQMRDEYRWDEQKQKSVKTGKRIPTTMWQTKPRTMLKKVAVEQTHRMAFPDEMGGLPYGEEELPVEREALRAEVIEVKRDAEKPAEKPTAKTLKRIEDEFTSLPKQAEPAKPAAPPADRESDEHDPLEDAVFSKPKVEREEKPLFNAEPDAVTSLQFQKMKAGIDALKQRGIAEDAIFEGIMKKVKKTYNVTIVELGDMKSAHADSVIAYLGAWAKWLDDEDAARKAGAK